MDGDKKKLIIGIESRNSKLSMVKRIQPRVFCMGGRFSSIYHEFSTPSNGITYLKGYKITFMCSRITSLIYGITYILDCTNGIHRIAKLGNEFAYLGFGTDIWTWTHLSTILLHQFPCMYRKDAKSPTLMTGSLVS